MTDNPAFRRRGAFATLVLVVLAGTTWYAAAELQRARAEQNAPTRVEVTEDVLDGPHVLFRGTAPGELYGRVAAVALDDLSGPREVTPVVCDRVSSLGGATVCLRTRRGVVTTYEAEVLDAEWRTTATWPLPGIPSRTRLSPDGLVATTAFVTGHSYSQAGFSTETTVHDIDGAKVSGNLEDFTLLADGERVAPVDRNVWGVTFVDDRYFYATVRSQSLGHTWLVRGDLTERTLVTVLDGVECPSLSPDGTRLAFKRDVAADGAAAPHWTPAVLDLDTLKVSVLDAERRTVDDQITWLDDTTLLYGLPRADEPGTTDVWSLPADGTGKPALAIPQAWSPSVVG
ncbi:PD40 domain-containing protein [Promicromonospora panici]|uniref:PD40 domain-containing protein n=1 Tax=Promicromonospora panici TaxID=2219658 RepID=UPI00101BEA21|nr:PD40 domain-containing protein [Promicromonospora panici]